MLLGTEVKLCKITSTADAKDNNSSYYTYKKPPDSQAPCGKKNLLLISHNRGISEDANAIIEGAHDKFHTVFNKDLSVGYNGFYGKHVCHLNWASSERPLLQKSRFPAMITNLRGYNRN